MQRAGVLDPAASARRMYRELGSALVELLWLAGAPASARRAAIAAVAIDDASLRALDEAVARGPVLLFASHTGNWELAAAAAARLFGARSRRLFVVAKEMHDRGVDAFLSRVRRLLDVHIIHPHGAMTVARHVLQNGDVVVMPIDQVPDRTSHGMRLPFLGDVAFVDRAPATLAWRARASVLVVAAERSGEVHRVRVLETVFAPSDPREVSARSWIDATTLRATFALDAFVRRMPHEWLWLHRRWKAPRGRCAPPVGALSPPLLSRRGMRSNSLEHHG